MTKMDPKKVAAPECLAAVLEDWCDSGAKTGGATISILTAFATGSGVQRLIPAFDHFLADENSLNVIFGIDRAGTDRRAIRALRDLQIAYPNQVRAIVFWTPRGNAIFHPKLYLFNSPISNQLVVGSNNLTMGGLEYNFESALFFAGLSNSDPVWIRASTIWNRFALPKPPIPKSALVPLTPDVAEELQKLLPERTLPDSPPTAAKSLPRKTGRHRPRQAKGAIRRYLLTDIMQESRGTQVQFPLRVFEDFFGVDREAAASLDIGILTSAGVTAPVARHVVRSGTSMRRIEMPQIRGLQRPLCALFVKLKHRNAFAFRLFPRRSTSHTKASRILDTYGQQGSGERRYYIGEAGDAPWKELATLSS